MYLAPGTFMVTWSIDRARRCYRIQGWGEGYFDINPQGHKDRDYVRLTQPEHGDTVKELLDYVHLVP